MGSGRAVDVIRDAWCICPAPWVVQGPGWSSAMLLLVLRATPPDPHLSNSRAWKDTENSRPTLPPWKGQMTPGTLSGPRGCPGTHINETQMEPPPGLG